jgi:HEAT repeats
MPVSIQEIEVAPERGRRHREELISVVVPRRPRQGWLARLLFFATAIISIWSPGFAAEKEPVAVQEWHRRGIVGALTDPNRQTLVAVIDLEEKIQIISGALELLKASDKAKLTGYLAKELSDDSPTVRAAAATALGQLGDKGIAPELVKLLQMDLTVVAEMLSRGEQPYLFRLREQQYRIMAGDCESRPGFSIKGLFRALLPVAAA